ncbi:unnamed protein product [Rotaria sp. Silwood2]|nr:unnamed protein product [Rotaria sp. Silwood2]CAF4162168.1 unnamed protein product [Rotaria sp. Silwood2]
MDSNKDQHIRKVQYFKKKYRKSNLGSKTISNEIMHQSIQKDIIEINQDKSISVSQRSSLKKKYYPLTTGSNIDPTLFLSDYLMISTENFQQMLFTIITTDIGRNFLVELFKNEETLTYICQFTQFINKLTYFKLQNDQWTYYYHLGMTKGIWTRRVSKKMAMVNSMCYTYGRRKTLIEQRRKYFQQQIENNTCEICEHLKQAPSSVDLNKLIEIVIDLVCQDQYQLCIELQRRRGMLKFDAKDHQWVETFYQLKPRQTEIHSAKIIWKATDDEQKLKYEIAMFKHWLSYESSSTYCTFQDLALTNINSILTNLLFDQQWLLTTNITMNEMKSMDTFMNELIMRTISVAEEIAQTYQQKAINEKTKILNNGKKLPKLPTVDTIITAIENRQTNMVHRAQYNIQQILRIADRKSITTEL